MPACKSVPVRVPQTTMLGCVPEAQLTIVAVRLTKLRQLAAWAILCGGFRGMMGVYPSVPQ